MRKREAIVDPRRLPAGVEVCGVGFDRTRLFHTAVTQLFATQFFGRGSFVLYSFLYICLLREHVYTRAHSVSTPALQFCALSTLDYSFSSL